MSAGEIRTRRLLLNLRLREVARRARVDPADLCRHEQGKAKRLSPGALARVVAVLEAEQARVEAERAARQRLATLAEVGLAQIGGANVS